MSAAQRRTLPVPRWIVLVMMLLFAAWFSAYSIGKHEAHLTHKADLGQIDQAVWNTAHGRILQEVKDDRISTRLTDHVEPIFLPVSLVFRLWNDVRALLILQAVLLAAGAWPIYLLARHRLSPIWESAAEGSSPATSMAEWGGAAFAAAYLLAPALQAAAVSEFHALPLAAPFIAAALWAVERGRWGWFVLWAGLVAATQEGAALLTVTLGLYAAARAISLSRRRKEYEEEEKKENLGVLRAFAVHMMDRRALFVGLGVALAGLAWFYVATFIIIPRFAAEAYALGQTPYAARYGALGDSFADVLVALVTRPFDVLRIAAEPLRIAYLAGLLLPVAGLALLGPELLLLSLPLLLANLLSSYPLQYSGELHYSAALTPFFTAAGAVGAARLLSWLASWPATARRRSLVSGVVFGAVVLCALGVQISEGFTPVGREFRAGEVAGWPRVTDHERLLARFAAQVPSEASLSTTPPLHPHLSHRRHIYQFPIIADAEYVLVDVSGTTDRHPTDVKNSLDGLLASGEFGVLDAADGYLLLQRGAAERALPATFFDFVRAHDEPDHALDIAFGDSLTLTGYTIEDEAKWRLTRFRFYWRVTQALPGDTAIRYQALTPSGAVVDDSEVRPLPALLWQPPAQWQPGETYVIETLAWYLPSTWAPALTVEMAGRRVWPEPVSETAEVALSPEGQLRLPAWTRSGGVLVPFAGPTDPVGTADVRFAEGEWQVRLTGWRVPQRTAPGVDLPVALRWTASGPAPRDDSVFVHLRDAAGQTAARGDAGPTWFVARPASRWPADADVWDAHTLALPADLPAGQYTVVIGWYDWQTGARLPLLDAAGNPHGDEYVLGSVTIDPQAGPTPDACCLMIGECCASLE